MMRPVPWRYGFMTSGGTGGLEPHPALRPVWVLVGPSGGGLRQDRRYDESVAIVGL